MKWMQKAPAESWRRDLYILWVCTFVTQLGFSLIMPFLSLYLEELGVQGSSVELWSGVVFSANFLMMALFAPLWGSLSDRFGHKPMMLRSSFGMALVVCFMGLVTNPWQLLGLRLLQGIVAGFIPAVTAYMASHVPKERSGWALGMLGTGTVAGTVLGPLVGGVLANVMGYRPIFYLTSVSCLLSGIVVWLTLHETAKPKERTKSAGMWSEIKSIRQYPIALAMAVVLFMNMFSMMTAEPVIARYLQHLKAPLEWVSFLSGVVFSMTGVANIIVAPIFGRISDRLGSQRVLAFCLGGAAVLYMVQGLATATWHMIALRFVLGLFTGGLQPAVNGLLARAVPREVQGRIFGITSAAVSVGQTVGPLVGGVVAAGFGLRAVFPVTGVLLLINLLWVLRRVNESPVQEVAS
jgi:MFS transporter, DHA1 family, multidrug resistance protein